ncbi:MAG: DUF3224 domain-containing protein [Chloroflexi bacterium]|nr:DUF3224 domain-containing protein [Chloroflexota bacterium]
MMPTKTTFKIVSWDERPFDEPESGPKLTHAHVQRSFDGELIGTGNLMYLMTHLDSGDATFLGYEKVVGSLGGRKGSFVLLHTGSYDGGKAKAQLEVVLGSGTEELTGLTGKGSFSAGHAEEHEMPFEYEI